MKLLYGSGVRGRFNRFRYPSFMGDRPLLCLDVDGVINLLDVAPGDVSGGVRFELIDGVPFALVAGIRDRLARLQAVTEPVWVTGWGARANRALAPVLGLDPLPEVEFTQPGGRHNAYWKVEGVDEFAGRRPLAWLDDSFDDRCLKWAQRRERAGHPTLLVPVDPASGLSDDEVSRIVAWSQDLTPMASEPKA